MPLDEKRVKEAEANVKDYLAEGLLKNVNQTDPNVFGTFRKNSSESLKVADHLFRNNLSYLWTVVCSYYSMYYIANAILYRIGYKVGEKISHKVTADALIVFARKKIKEGLVESFEEAKTQALDLAGIKAYELIQNFDYERNKRSRFQYEMTEEIKMGKAETSLKRAKEFVFEIEKLMV